MLWHAAIELSGTLTDEQIEALCDEDQPRSAVFDRDLHTAELRVTVDAETYVEAVRAAIKQFNQLPRVRALISQGVLSEPRRFTIQNEEAHEQASRLLSTAGVARRLGVSEARVRQLKGSIDFPIPLKIPGAAGHFYDTVAIDTYRTNRRKSSGGQGKPRATDEPMLDYALRRIEHHADLTPAQRGRVERALAASGGRHIRGKANLVIDMLASHPDLVQAVSDDPEFGSAWRRAIEINES